MSSLEDLISILKKLNIRFEEKKRVRKVYVRVYDKPEISASSNHFILTLKLSKNIDMIIIDGVYAGIGDYRLEVTGLVFRVYKRKRKYYLSISSRINNTLRT